MTQPLPNPIMGIDEAWAKADPQGAAAKGFHFVIGYISQDRTGKDLTPADVTAIHAAGLDIALVFEYNPSSALGGAYAGTQDATIAVQQARALSVPEGVAIYFAVDFNPSDTTISTQVTAYLAAANQVCWSAGYYAGVYGGYAVVKYALDHGIVKYAWQTYAWSGGTWDPRAVLRQVLNGVTVAGADVDEDSQVWPDFGQWRPDGSVGAPAPSQNGTQMEQIDKAISVENPGSEYGDSVGGVLVDLENLRVHLYQPPGEDAKNPAPAGSRLDLIVQAAQKILATPAPAPSSPTPTAPEQQLLDLWGRIATALEEVAVSLAAHAGAAIATQAATSPHSAALMASQSTSGIVPPPTQEAPVAAAAAPVDSQP